MTQLYLPKKKLEVIKNNLTVNQEITEIKTDLNTSEEDENQNKKKRVKKLNKRKKRSPKQPKKLFLRT